MEHVKHTCFDEAICFGGSADGGTKKRKSGGRGHKVLEVCRTKQPKIQVTAIALVTLYKSGNHEASNSNGQYDKPKIGGLNGFAPPLYA